MFAKVCGALVVGWLPGHGLAKWVSHEDEALQWMPDMGARAISLNSHAVGLEHEHSFLEASAHEQRLHKARDTASADALAASNVSSGWVVDDDDIPTIEAIVAMLSTDPDDLVVTWFNHPDAPKNWYYESLNYVSRDPADALTWHLLFGHGFAPALASRTDSTFETFMATMPYEDPVPTEGTDEAMRTQILLARRDHVVDVLLAYAKTAGLFDKIAGMKLKSIRHLHEHDHLGPDAPRWSSIPLSDEETRAKIPTRDYQVAGSAKTLAFLKALSGGDDDFKDWRVAVDKEKDKLVRSMTGFMSLELRKAFNEHGFLGSKTGSHWYKFRDSWMQPTKTQETQKIELRLLRVPVTISSDVAVIKGTVVYEGSFKSEVYVEISDEDEALIESLAIVEGSGGTTVKDMTTFEPQAKMMELVMAWRRGFIESHATFFDSKKLTWFGGEIANLIDKMAGKVVYVVIHW